MPGTAGIVLAGGRSSRMRTPKAALEWHGSTLLRRTVGIISRVTDGSAVVVRAPGQALPSLPPGTEVIDDPQEGLGPLQGLAAGLAAIAGRAQVAFVSATDLPFLHPAFVRRVLCALPDGADVALPVARGYPQPLAAAYRTALAPLTRQLVAQQHLRLVSLFEQCAVARLDEALLLADPVLAALDSALDSLININEPAGYQSARAQPAPEVIIRLSGPLADGRPGPQPARAATVAAAAGAVGLVLDGHVVADVNGAQLTSDGQAPLAAGDIVVFQPAT